jgi:hypothetical protein
LPDCALNVSQSTPNPQIGHVSSCDYTSGECSDSMQIDAAVICNIPPHHNELAYTARTARQFHCLGIRVVGENADYKTETYIEGARPVRK